MTKELTYEQILDSLGDLTPEDTGIDLFHRGGLIASPPWKINESEVVARSF